METNETLFLGLFLLSFLCLAGCQQAPAQVTNDQSAQSLPPIGVYFSPKGGCTEAVVKELERAKATRPRPGLQLHVACPSPRPWSMPTSEASRSKSSSTRARRSEKYSSADFVVNAGIPMQIDAKHAIAHNKVMVIDGQTVITGSFNFTKAAEENNAENLLVIRSPELAAKYAANWKVHADHSDPYAGRTEGYSQTHRAAAEPPKTDATRCRRIRGVLKVAGLPPARLQVERPRFRRRTSSITRRGTRRSRRARNRVQSAIRRGTLPWRTCPPRTTLPS